MSEHLSDEDLASLLDDASGERLSGTARAHLARCDRCRREHVRQWREARAVGSPGELADVPAVLERDAVRLGVEFAASDDRPAGVRWLGRVPVLSAAAVALVAAGVFLLVDGSPERPLRSGPARSETDDADRRLIGPAGTVEAAGGLVFEWRAVAGAVAYEVTVADVDAGGEIVLRQRTESTRYEPTDEESGRFVPGRAYVWFVRAESEEGTDDVFDPLEFSVSEK